MYIQWASYSVQFTILITAFPFSTDRSNCRRGQEAVGGAIGELQYSCQQTGRDKDKHKAKTEPNKRGEL